MDISNNQVSRRELFSKLVQEGAASIENRRIGWLILELNSPLSRNCSKEETRMRVGGNLKSEPIELLSLGDDFTIVELSHVVTG